VPEGDCRRSSQRCWSSDGVAKRPHSGWSYLTGWGKDRGPWLGGRVPGAL